MLKGGEDFGLRWFDYRMEGIAWEFRANDTRQLPAGPRAPAALVTAGFVHAIRQVLEMDTGIADENIRRRVAQEPAHPGIGQGPAVQFRFIALQVGAKTAV